MADTGWFTVGQSRIRQIPEVELPAFPATRLLPGFDASVLERRPDWAPPGTIDAAGNARVSVHSWLVQHGGQTLLIDTGAGNGKTRPGVPALDRLDTPFLQRLEAAGVQPDKVDAVLLTHLHSDHVGWNTELRDGAWQPTFPNATVICSAREWCYAQALADGDAASAQRLRAEAGLGEPVRLPTAGIFDDSLRPLEATGRLQRIAVDGSEVLPGVRFVSTPGHSLDHASIELTSGGALAIFGGDVLHHPLQVYDPALVSVFCEFPEAARASRRSVLARAADTGALYLSSHFPLSGAGRIRREGDGFAWAFAGPVAG